MKKFLPALVFVFSFFCFGFIEGQVVVPFTTPGVHTWEVPDGITSVDVLIVGGGGSGGTSAGGSAGAGGGGSGGLIFEEGYTVNSGDTINIYVGEGGVAPTSDADTQGNPGENSEAFGFTAIGGGGGGSRSGITGGDGGSGGGGGPHGSLPGSAVDGGSQGSDGGLGPYDDGGDDNNAGGGGGFSEAGGEALDNNYGGDGGDGIDLSSKFGTTYGDSGWFAGGGGGGVSTHSSGSTPGNGGIGGGGDGGDGLGGIPGSNGMSNTGGGGGGQGDATGSAAGDGGSGIVLISYNANSRATSLDVHDTYSPIMLNYSDGTYSDQVGGLTLNNIPPNNSFNLTTSTGRTVLSVDNYTTINFSLFNSGISQMATITEFNVDVLASASPAADFSLAVRNPDVSYTVKRGEDLVSLISDPDENGMISFLVDESGSYTIEMNDQEPLVFTHKITSTSYNNNGFSGTLNSALLCTGVSGGSEVDLYFEYADNQSFTLSSFIGPVTSSTPSFFSIDIRNLEEEVGETYYYRAFASRDDMGSSISNGNTRSFIIGRRIGQVNLNYGGKRRFIDVLVSRINRGFTDILDTTSEE